MAKKKTVQRETIQLNQPAKVYFRKKLKCVFSTNEFRFLAGKLDVLAYDRKEKCFHVAEGKLAGRTASVGHAVGQLIAYISMLQENGFDFLNRISKEANLYLTDFTDFFENQSIKVCFYIVLPYEQRRKILDSARLMLGNIGDFGDKIGVLYANKSKCLPDKYAKPISIKIRRKYNPKEFIDAISDKFLSLNIARSLEERQTQHNNVVQFREKNGHPYLHFEVKQKRKRKNDQYYTFEIAFHLEWGISRQKDARTAKRARKICREMAEARGILKKHGYDFKYQPEWGTWSRLYIDRKTTSTVLDNDFLDDVLKHLKVLAETLTPRLNKINWGKTQKKSSMRI